MDATRATKKCGTKVGAAFTRSSEMVQFSQFPLDDGYPYDRQRFSLRPIKKRHRKDDFAPKRRPFEANGGLPEGSSQWS